MTMYLRPTAATARSALLPGDPKRAMELAAELMDRPLMSNLSRGLWGYWGQLGPGRELTVQSTGIGGPSAAAVVADLAALGVLRVVRVGTCIALDPELEAGQAIVVSAALAGDGVGGALASSGVALPDPAITGALGDSGCRIASVDLFPKLGSAAADEWVSQGAIAIDLSTAAVFAAAANHGIAAACALVVSRSSSGLELKPEALDQACLSLGNDAAMALLATEPKSAPAAG